jgi:hypothetical protein
VQSFGKRIDGPARRSAGLRRQVDLAGSVVTIYGSKSVLVEDLCPGGAKLLGRHLPSPGEEVLLRASELSVLGHIAWANDDYRGVIFEDADRPSAGMCLALQMRSAA